MRVNALDHVNIATDDVPGTARFYAEVLGLDARDVPGGAPPEIARWIYDHQDRPIIHVASRSVPQSFPRDCPPGATGPIHHVALNCSGRAELVERLQARGAAYQVNEVEIIGLTQVFTHDPNGVLLELNFFGD
jgi:catechol 2,3-dioxygenase-like lactoylglutathione lyase family enzyme